jgi:DNA repair exonuclease SbcCD ATPase subunit
MARHAVPVVVAEFAAELADAQSKRCLRHSWERRGATWDAENPTYWRCRVCHVDQDEIENALSEAQEQIGALTTDCNRETERADTAETMARVNGDTIVGQQQHVHQLEDTIARLRGKLRHFTEMQTELETTVVVLRSGKRRTLWSLYETGDTEDLCPTCLDPTCESCTPPDAVLRREAAEDEGDES